MYFIIPDYNSLNLSWNPMVYVNCNMCENVSTNHKTLLVIQNTTVYFFTTIQSSFDSWNFHYCHCGATVIMWFVFRYIYIYLGIFCVAVSFIGGETDVHGKNNPTATSHWQTLSHNVVLSTSRSSRGFLVVFDFTLWFILYCIVFFSYILIVPLHEIVCFLWYSAFI